MESFLLSALQHIERLKNYRFVHLVVLGLLTFIVLIAFSPGWNIGYYADCYLYIFNNPADKIFYFFTHPNPYDIFYRPTMTAIVMISQAVEGMNTRILHTVHFAGHILCTFVVFVASRRLTGSVGIGVGAALYMLCAESSGYAIFNIGALSQILGTLFGYAALWSLYCFYVPPMVTGAERRGLYYGLAVLSFLAAIFSKETSMSFLPMICVLIAIIHSGGKLRLLQTREFWQKCLRDGTLFVVLGISFLLFRKYVVGIVGQPEFGDSRYQMKIGLNIVVNIGQTLFAMLQPISTADIFVAWKVRNWYVLAAAGAAFVLVFGALLWGLVNAWRKENLRTVIVATLVLFPFSMIPMMFLNHVGELYSYNSLPLVALLVGISLYALRHSFTSHRSIVVLLAGFAVVLVVHLSALQRKADGMKENARLAALYLPQIMPIMASMPQHGRLVLLNTASPRAEYSIIYQRGFSVFRFGTPIFQERTGRFDIKVEVCEPDTVRMETLRGATVLTLKNDTSVVVQAYP